MGMFNLSVIPDWEMIGSARRHLSSLDCSSEVVNPQALNCVPWNGGDSPSQQTKQGAAINTVYRVTTTIQIPLATKTGTVTVTKCDCLARHRQER